MKTQTPHNPTDLSTLPLPGNPPPLRHQFKLGLDVDLNFIVVAIQCDHGAIKPAQKFTPDQLVAWIQEQVAAGHEVQAVSESCGFGYTLHYALVAAGAHSIMITPTRLDPTRRRKNDRLDARALCQRLSRYLDGNRAELAVIRIPTPAEQQRRELGRQREFLKRELRRLENHGRALRIEHEHRTLELGWAGPRKWKRLSPQLSDFVRSRLEPFVGLIRTVKQQLAALSQEIEGLVVGQSLPKGLGALTSSLIDGEVCDWGRFQHRKAPASYTGCCPSEHSSGGVQRTGHIDRHGNQHLRVLLIEAVWRLLKYQTQWHAYQKAADKMRAGGGVRKKMVVALARQLSIDLWRWKTNRCTLAELGLLPN